MKIIILHGDDERKVIRRLAKFIETARGEVGKLLILMTRPYLFKNN